MTPYACPEAPLRAWLALLLAGEVYYTQLMFTKKAKLDL
jgi:hypothetical protein